MTIQMTSDCVALAFLRAFCPRSFVSSVYRACIIPSGWIPTITPTLLTGVTWKIFSVLTIDHVGRQRNLAIYHHHPPTR